jgi:hypothetical protein
MKPLICCSFLVFLFGACHERPASAPAVLPAGISDLLAQRTMGTYTGQFGKGLITLVVNYINGPTVSGYDIHKGLRRNFNGEISQQGGLLQLVLKEPGSNPFDGTFSLSLDTAKMMMKGRWAPFDSTKAPVRKLALDRKESNDGYVILAGAWYAGRDSTLNLEGDGTCTFEFYERPDDSTSQLITLRGNYTFRGSECTIDWAKNKYFPSLKLVVQPPSQSPDSAGAAPPEMRGNGMKFVMSEGEED